MNMHKINSYKTPWVALVWSLFMPGFGQLYNNNYFHAFFFISMEIFINNMGKINLSIYHSFNGDFLKALEILNFQWAMFYPCLYAFSAWDAFNRAKIINHELNKEKVELPERVTYLNGLFIGTTVGLNLGLLWGVMGSPIFGTLLGGMVGAIIGVITENVIKHVRVK